MLTCTFVPLVMRWQKGGQRDVLWSECNTRKRSTLPIVLRRDWSEESAVKATVRPNDDDSVDKGIKLSTSRDRFPVKGKDV